MQGGELIEADPASLAAASGRTLPLGNYGYSWSFSASGSQLAVGGFGANVLVVDATTVRPLRTLKASGSGLIVALAWPSPRRLIALIDDSGWRGRHRLVTLDPVARSPAHEHRLQGERPIADVAVLPKRGLALLLVPRSSFGAPQLAVLQPDGRLRVAALSKIVSGWDVSQPGRSPRQRVPALAVDPAGTRAVVVPPTGAVAEIRLADLQVRYHVLERKGSFGRQRNRVRPAADAKGPRASVREARWLENNRIAVSGFDSDGSETTGAGLDLIDPDDWSVATLKAGASRFAYARPFLLAYGGRARGVTAYSGTRKRWTLLPHREIGLVETLAQRAYVLVPLGRLTRTITVDLPSGRVLRRTETPWVQLLVPDAGSLADTDG